MSTTRIVGLALLASFALIAARAVAEEPKSETKAENKLVGSWKLVSAKYGGQEAKFPEGHIMLKHVTPTQFIWVTYDKDGKVTLAAGGGYTLKGEDYVETPEYGVGQVLEAIKGKTLAFKWKIEKNKWHHSGKLPNGEAMEEVWERVEKK